MEGSAPVDKKPEVSKPATRRGCSISPLPSVTCFITFYGVLMTSSGGFHWPIHTEFSPNSRGKKPKDFSGSSPGMQQGRHGPFRLTLTSLSNRISSRVSPLLSLETQPSKPLLQCFVSYLMGSLRELSPASLCPAVFPSSGHLQDSAMIPAAKSG